MGALTGIKILDFSTLLPGPYASMILADMGAEVVRISSKSRADLTLAVPPLVPGTQVTAIASSLCRNKKSLSLNFKAPEARDIIFRLLGEYDVVLEQFRPGAMERLGLGYEAMRAVNPKVIYCSLTGYGQTGPLRDLAGHDINYLARSGVMSYSGRPGEGPSLMGMQVADLAAGSMNAAVGILAAIVSRSFTGRGQYIDVSMLDGAVAYTMPKGAVYLVDGNEPGPCTQRTNGAGIYDFFETADGKYLSVGSLEPAFFEKFCRCIGAPELIPGGCIPADPGPAKQRVAGLLRAKTRDEWMEIFRAQDACVEPVLTMREALGDPHIAARGMVVPVPDYEDPGILVPQIANPIRFSETPNEYRHGGTPTGSHTLEILASLGYDERDISRLQAAGALD